MHAKGAMIYHLPAMRFCSRYAQFAAFIGHNEDTLYYDFLLSKPSVNIIEEPLLLPRRDVAVPSIQGIAGVNNTRVVPGKMQCQTKTSW